MQGYIKVNKFGVFIHMQIKMFAYLLLSYFYFHYLTYIIIFMIFYIYLKKFKCKILIKIWKNKNANIMKTQIVHKMLYVLFNTFRYDCMYGKATFLWHGSFLINQRLLMLDQLLTSLPQPNYLQGLLLYVLILSLIK